jgi:hypothetical protein
MPARLSVHAAEGAVSVFHLEEGREYVLGRDPGCDVAVDDDRVSRRHARLAAGPGGGWRLRDLGSKNGVSVDGRRAAEHRWTGAAWIGLGEVPLRFEPLDAAAARAAGEEELERRRAGARLQRGLDPSLGLGALLDRVLASVMSMAGGRRGFLLLASPDGGHRLARTAGLDAADLGRGEFGGSVGAVERVLAERRPVVCCDARADTLLGRRSSIQTGGVRALACLPLVVLDRLLGVVYVDSGEPGRTLTDLDVEILQGLADHAALGLAVAGLGREVAGLGVALPDSAPAAGEGDDDWRRLTAVHRLPADAPGAAAAAGGMA